MNKIKESISSFVKEEEGVGVVELILILAILVCLVVIFRGKIETLVSSAYQQLNSDSSELENYSGLGDGGH